MNAFSKFVAGFKDCTPRSLLWSVLFACCILAIFELSLGRGWLWRAELGTLLSDPTDDWTRAMWSISRAEKTSSDGRVFILGGSSAREAFISDESVRLALADSGLPTIDFVNLGTRNQSLYESLVLVEHLPATKRGLVVMALTPALFRDGLDEARAAAHGARIPLYSFALNNMLKAAGLLERPVLPINVLRFRGTASKYLKTRASNWTFFESLPYKHHFLLGTQRLPDEHLLPSLRKLSIQMRSFPANAPFNFEVLAKSITLAREKGYAVLLVDMPRNPATEKVLYSAYLDDYKQAMMYLSQTAGVDYEDLHERFAFPYGFYYDHIHLLDGARPQFQARFVALLIEKLAGLAKP